MSTFVASGATMYDPKGDDPVKLRRFALTLAAILFGYALVGAQVKPEFNILGVPFLARRPQLLPFALIGVAALRPSAAPCGMVTDFHGRRCRGD